jgi:hypothetical protein
MAKGGDFHVLARNKAGCHDVAESITKKEAKS